VEKPDKRIMPLVFLVLIASVVWCGAWLFTAKDSQIMFYVELVLYVVTIAYGLAVALLSHKLQYSVMRPSVSKAQDPQMFMMEVWMGGYACAAFGAWLLYGLLK
jgi:hypothetical protein